MANSNFMKVIFHRCTYNSSLSYFVKYVPYETYISLLFIHYLISKPHVNIVYFVIRTIFVYKNYKLLHYVTCATFPLSPPISMKYLSKTSVFGHT